MNSQFLNIISCSALLIGLAGCAATNHVAPAQIPVMQHIDDNRYERDRSLTLSDVSPVAPAYVEFPFDACNPGEVKAAARAGMLLSDLSSPRAERIFRLPGGKKCIAH